MCSSEIARVRAGGADYLEETSSVCGRGVEVRGVEGRRWADGRGVEGRESSRGRGVEGRRGATGRRGADGSRVAEGRGVDGRGVEGLRVVEGPRGREVAEATQIYQVKRALSSRPPRTLEALPRPPQTREKRRGH